MEKRKTIVTGMPDTGVSRFLIGRCGTMRMVITRRKLAKTTKRLVGVNGRQMGLNLTVGKATISQMVYVTPQVTCMFLS